MFPPIAFGRPKQKKGGRWAKCTSNKNEEDNGHKKIGEKRKFSKNIAAQLSPILIPKGSVNFSEFYRETKQKFSKETKFSLFFFWVSNISLTEGPVVCVVLRVGPIFIITRTQLIFESTSSFRI